MILLMVTQESVTIPHRASHDDNPDDPVIEVFPVNKISDTVNGRLLIQRNNIIDFKKTLSTF